MVEQVFSFCVKITVLYECGTTYLCTNGQYSHNLKKIIFYGILKGEEKSCEITYQWWLL